MEKKAVSIHIEPAQAMVDEKVSIQLSQLMPGQRVTLQAEAQDDNGIHWSSTAIFKANKQGKINLSEQPPLQGTYQYTDPMGPFWSMIPNKQKAQPNFFAKKTLQPILINFKAETDDKRTAEFAHTRYFLSNDVYQRTIQEPGIVGIIYHPSSGGPYPGIILLSGSSGNIRTQDAALLAKHGYCALALSYFGTPPLPQTLQEISLEYLQTAIHWLQNLPITQADKIALIGSSKGAELALLGSALFPEVGAVISYAPSAVIHQGLGATEEKPQEHSSWTYQGKPLPFLPMRYSSAFQEYLRTQERLQAPIAFRQAYLDSLHFSTQFEQAHIPVEHIRGPILLISGQDDQMWPSAHFAEMITQRLSRQQHPYPYQHLSYTDAGHKLGYPYLPTTITQSRGYAYGGTAQGNAQAIEHAWKSTLTFLAETFK